MSKNIIIAVASPDRGASNDPEPLGLDFNHEGSIFSTPLANRGYCKMPTISTSHASLACYFYVFYQDVNSMKTSSTGIIDIL